MASGILALRGIRLQAPEGRDVFTTLDWSLPYGGRVQLEPDSGAGTTAFLRLCAGLALPQEGAVVLDGVPLNAFDFAHPFLAKGGLGWVPSGGGLLVNQNLLANLILPLRFARGLPLDHAETLGREGLKRVGLQHLAHQRPHALEPRERWLAALVRASLGNPELWLVDQPPGDLEETTEAAARDLLTQAFQDSGVSAVLVGEGGWIPDGMKPQRLNAGCILEEQP